MTYGRRCSRSPTGLPERLERRHELLALLELPAVAREQHHDQLAVRALVDPRRRRGLAHHRDERELGRRVGRRLAEGLEHLRRGLGAPGDRPAHDLRADLLELVLDARHDAEVAAAAAQAPEEVRVLLLARAQPAGRPPSPGPSSGPCRSSSRSGATGSRSLRPGSARRSRWRRRSRAPRRARGAGSRGPRPPAGTRPARGRGAPPDPPRRPASARGPAAGRPRRAPAPRCCGRRRASRARASARARSARRRARRRRRCSAR